MGLIRSAVVMLLGLLSAPGAAQAPSDVSPLRIVVIGLVHGHVEGVLWAARERADLQIVGVYDPDRALFDKHKAKYRLADELYFDDLGRMLDETKPEAASVMTAIADHLAVVQACAPRGVPVLLEKPLAFSAADAEAIAALAREHNMLVLTNYETSWYASVRTAARLAKETGPINRAVFRHGHRGPREIGCSEEFLAWLTDPAQNGGGAIVDFGCYGANIMTWLMDNRLPDSVMATTNQLKPDLYPNVDDDATIVLTYAPDAEKGLPGAVGVLQASWAWTHDNKDADFFTPAASYHAAKWDNLTVRKPDQPADKHTVDERPDWLRDEWTYLRQVVRGQCPVDPLSSPENNVIVARILDAARESARTGRAVRLNAD
ncbi:Gfo/Idh/MocA family protein [Nodularia spumigena]|uniref:Gfo/Idh/MocA family protein n=1 Tax=Nodularia spumigena TaxID=70799 RepID=UPI002B1F0D57|nr:Gfo/Idh/MocA family oxidoreductase [Nodularia spumigena]MEA5615445.1 Gfo/Idh/MocA family oxidoreductase [Nodularia spumigena UHCC 0040]